MLQQTRKKRVEVIRMLRILKNKISRNRIKFFYVIVFIGFIFYLQHKYMSEHLTMNLKDYNQSKNPQEMDHVDFNTTAIIFTESILKPTGAILTTKANGMKFNENNGSRKFAAKHKLGYKIGHVNVHLWYKMCTADIDSLRQNPLFPLWPSIRGQPEMPDELVSIMTSKWSAQRIMGLLYPPVSGDYRFEISSVTISEFWLSTSEDPEKVVLMARSNKNILHGVRFAKGALIPKSESVHLDQGQAYYFEMIHGMNDVTRDQVQIRWMLPGSMDFTGIPRACLSTVIINDTSLDLKTRQLVLQSPSIGLQNNYPTKPELYRWDNSSFSKRFNSYPLYTRNDLNSLKFANGSKIMSAFEDCDYKPSYLQKRNYKRFEGAYFTSTRLSDVFPEDGTDRKLWQGKFKNVHYQKGNTEIKEDVVIDIVKALMLQLNIKFPGEYLLANVVNVERKVDVQRGSRFFLELVLLEVKSKELQRLSEYFYQFKNNSNSSICKPKGFKWSPTVKINAILTAKNQGPWVVHYIKSMAQVLRATHDNHVHLIIVDYGNDGVDVEEELRRNKIKSFTLIKKTEKFHKTLAIDEAAKSIKDNNSIVFLTDLHLDVPNDIFQSVRKHTIKGKMTYTPVVFRLTHCGRPEGKQTSAAGHWEIDGYGIFSSYMSDWKSFGGVNVKEFQYKWGGEDSEMADRVLNKGFEIERLRLPGLYHFFHDKKGMWHNVN